MYIKFQTHRMYRTVKSILFLPPKILYIYADVSDYILLIRNNNQRRHIEIWINLICKLFFWVLVMELFIRVVCVRHWNVEILVLSGWALPKRSYWIFFIPWNVDKIEKLHVLLILQINIQLRRSFLNFLSTKRVKNCNKIETNKTVASHCLFH